MLYCCIILYQEILLNATTRRGRDGEVTGVIGVGQDTTTTNNNINNHTTTTNNNNDNDTNNNHVN